MKQESYSLKEGLVAGIPIVIGYFPVAMAFGLLAKTVNISLLDSCLFSLIVFAGASQFMALDLIKAGIATGDIVLATFLLNLRHLMMSASLAVRIKDAKRGWLPFIAFGITDESFSVASLKNGKLSVPFLLALQGIAYTSWASGTFAGYLLGTALPISVQSSLGIGLYAMFTAILVPEIRKSANVLCLAAISGIIYAFNDYFNVLPSGWSLIVSIIFASLIGLFVLKDETKECPL
ncbi:AzlC family ABC transporter permease [Sporomusa malonica]|uniref:4-azaleucine resistance probable transporter AzlC n=1 Tax=Sporomusa malonica TaxID=112901 RepID=A0A1W2CXB6_9FIRM|nr:AzlC family ABC transporter permease [Sporomusa malonica]SMC89800.1 4-azaleucine resistance probable transporter AzlC [Sporomusa malonica]